MKNWLSISVLLFLVNGMLMAQSQVDALRYSRKELNGTARYKSMSGAFLSLGGDISAMTENPAGSSIFLQDQFIVTFRNKWTHNQATFQGGSNIYSGTDLQLAQIGAVLYINDNRGKKGYSWSMGYNYQKDLSFDEDQISFSGKNKQSVIDYFGAYASGFSASDLELKKGENLTDAYADIGENGGFAMQQAFLGYQAGLIKENGTAGVYTPDATRPAEGLLQKYVLRQNGGLSKHTINLSFNYQETVSFGANMNLYSLDYKNAQTLNESGYTQDSKIQNVTFVNRLSTYQERAYSFQLGMIAKPMKNVRFAVAYHSPIWFNLVDETTQSLRSRTSDESINVSPNTINTFRYKLKTPSEFQFGGAYIFDKKGLVSIDYGVKNYANMRLSSEDIGDFEDVNSLISNTFGLSQTLRLGGEYRATSRVSLRGGYRFEQSPYKDTIIMGHLNGWSLGVGYRFSGFIMDISYDMSIQKYKHQMYERGLTTTANINGFQHNILLTILVY